jgi:ketosteroid isomerase-like protein
MAKGNRFYKVILTISPRQVSALLFVGLVVLTGCQNPGASQTPQTAVSSLGPRAEAPKAEAPEEHTANRRRILLDTDIDFARVSEEKGTAEAYLEFLASDAILLPEGELPIQGRDAIKVHQAAGPEGVLLWKPRAVELASSGDVGFTWGICEFRQSDVKGRQAVRYGKYVTAWKKQIDGSWKAQLLIRNASPPPEQRR